MPGGGGEEDNEQKTPEAKREIQAFGRESEWMVRAAGKDKVKEDVGLVRMSTWHFVVFIPVSCLFHHFYGLVRRRC